MTKASHLNKNNFTNHLNMPEISTGSQVFDIVFHPSHSTVYTGLLTGHVCAFAYDNQGHCQRTFSVQPSKRSCRALTINTDGSHLYAAGKAKSLNIIDTVTEHVETRVAAHDSAINRIKYLMPWLLATGDDDGVIKLWDPRQRENALQYSHHIDYITDFLWLEDKKHLVATSGDGTLSVIDIRSKQPKPFAQSEDQEDELLSIVAIKGASKVVVGTQLGILSIFNRSAGWGDCVDRIPGHPHSVDAMCALPSDFSDVDTSSIILTGSSDGFVRAVEILPTKILGTVVDHGEWPVERIAIGCGTNQLTLEGADVPNSGGKKGAVNQAAEGAEHLPARWWVGSLGHEEVFQLTDLNAFFHETLRDVEQDEGLPNLGPSHGEGENMKGNEGANIDSILETDEDLNTSELLTIKKRKRKTEKKLPVTKKKGKNYVDVEPTFFDGL